MNLNKKGWTEGLKTADFKEHDKQNQDMVKNMLELAKAYNKAVQDEDEKTAEKFQIDQVSPFSRLYFCDLSLQPAQPFSKSHGLPSSRVSSKSDVFSNPHSPPPLFTTFFTFTLPLLPLPLLVCRWANLTQRNTWLRTLRQSCPTISSSASAPCLIPSSSKLQMLPGLWKKEKVQWQKKKEW